jgi:transcriptional regulator with XRE-family HTH domain
MATTKTTRKPRISHATSAAGLAKNGEFDRVAQSLAVGVDQIRPRSWLLRIGALLHKTRTHKHLKQEEMAQTAGVTQAYLSRLERGLIPKRGPTVDVLLRCAEAAGCDIEIAVRSRKDHTLIGTVSSADLVSVGSQASYTAPKANPAEIVEVIFEPQPTTARGHQDPTAGSTKEVDFTHAFKAIEQAQASLTGLLRKYETIVSGGFRSGITPSKSVDLGLASGEVTTDLVHALEAVWPYRRQRRLMVRGNKGVPGAHTVRAAAGDLVIIAGAGPAAAAGSVRVTGLEGAGQVTESDT